MGESGGEGGSFVGDSGMFVPLLTVPETSPAATTWNFGGEGEGGHSTQMRPQACGATGHSFLRGRSPMFTYMRSQTRILFCHKKRGAYPCDTMSVQKTPWEGGDASPCA